jgi:hypothetical protein
VFTDVANNDKNVSRTGWMSDIDLINYGFPPQQPWNGPVLYSFHGFVPALVTGNKQAFQAMIDAIVKVARNVTAAAQTPAIMVTPDGKQMTSDMLILLSRPDLYLNLRFPMSIMGPDMNKTVLLHFDKAEVNTWASTLGILSRKSRVIRKVRDFRK